MLLDDNNDIFKVAVAEGGGLGDAIMATSLCQVIFDISVRKVEIDLYCRSYKMYEKFAFINNAYPYTSQIDKNKYDLILIGHRFFIVSYADYEKVENYSPKLVEWCRDEENLISNVLRGKVDNYIISRYSLIKGKTRIEQFNVNDILPFSIDSPRYMPLDISENYILEKYKLEPNKYIIVNRAVDGKYGNSHPKLWPLDRYEQLVTRIKSLFPAIKIVQIGDKETFGIIKGADVNLIGKTTFEQCKILLKNSMALIAGEGGLVHLNHYLYGKSVVIFGPTLPEIFAYKENTNVIGTGCAQSCENITEDWSRGCVAGYKNPKCIDSITVDKMFDAVTGVIRDFIYAKYNIKVRTAKDEAAISNLLNSNDEGKSLFIGNYNGTMSSKMVKLSEDKTQKSGNSIWGSKYNLPYEDGTVDKVIVNSLGASSGFFMLIRELLRILSIDGIAYIFFRKHEKVYLQKCFEELYAMKVIIDDNDNILEIRKGKFK